MKARIEVLLSAWAKWATTQHVKAIGYASVSPMFRDAPSGRGYGSAPPFGSMMGHDVMEEVNAAVGALPTILRIVVIEFYFIGGSMRDVGSRLGVSAVSVGKFLGQAYERLESVLQVEKC